MFDVMESFVSQNRRAKVKGATRVKALYRSTLAGAVILGLGKSAGNFMKGKEANFIVVPTGLPVLQAGDAEEILSALSASVRDRSEFDTLVAESWLKGKRIA
jgi:guanine deaminase